MAENMIDMLKSCFEGVAEQFDFLEAAGAWNTKEEFELSARELLELDMAAFMIYFTKSDGKLTEEEFAFFCIMTDKTPEEAQVIFEDFLKSDMYDDDYLNSPPIIMLQVVSAERKFKELGGNISESILGRLAELYIILAKFMCSADGNLSPEEQRDVEKVSVTMRSFVDMFS